MKILILLIFVCAVLLVATEIKAENFWEQVNGPYGGKIRCTAVGKNDEILAATAGAGLYKSTDNGEHWFNLPIRDDVRDILSVMYNSKGDIFIVSVEAGIFRSKDNGKSWTNLTHGLETVYFDWTLVNNIYESNDRTLYLVKSEGVWRSDDNGDYWEQKSWHNRDYDPICSFAVNKKNGYIFYSIPGKVYISNDKGDNWDIKEAYITNGFYHSMVVANNGDIIIVTLNAFCKSKNNGSDWSFITNGLDSSNTNKYLSIDIQGNIYVWIKQKGIYISKDNGETWLSTGYEAKYLTVNSFGFNSKNETFLGTSSGIYFSKDGCKHLEFKSYGVNNVSVSKMLKNDKGDIFVNTSVGVYKTTDKGQSWIRLTGEINNYSLKHFILTGNGLLYAATDDRWYLSQRRGILVSSDNGDSWQKISQNLNDTLFSSLEAGANGYIYAGTPKGLYRSTNKGQTWEYKNPVATDSALVFALSINQKGEIYAGAKGNNSSNNYFLIKSTDNGDTWTNIFPFSQDFSIYVNEENHIYLLFGNYYSIQFSSFIRSMDDCKTWQNFKQSGFSILSNKNVLWTGASFSIDNGVTWIDAGKGMYNHPVYSLLALDSRKIWAGTDNGGIFRSLFNTDDVKILYQKPAPADTITLDLEETANITMTALDRHNKTVSNTTIIITDKLTNTKDTIITDSQGIINYQTKVPYEFVNNLYPIYFTASNIDYINISLDTVYIKVYHIDTLSLYVEPLDTQTIYQEDWIPMVTYLVTVNDYRKHLISNASIQVDNELEGRQIEIGSMGDGKAFYSTQMEDVLPEGVYQLKFMSYKQDFVSSKSVSRYIRVKSGSSDVNKKEQSLSKNIIKDFTITPNPIITKGRIGFNLDSPSLIRISIRDIFGNEVAKLNDGYCEAGHNEIEINSEKLSSQIYFVILESGGYREVKLMVIEK